MIEPAIIAARSVQYLGAAIVLGLPLFLLFWVAGSGPPTLQARARGLVVVGAAVLASTSLLSIGLQASLFSGSFADGFSAEGFATVISFMGAGKAALVRAGAAALALVLLIAAPRGRATWTSVAFLGGICAASAAWMGHGAATGGAEGVAHLAADIAHSLAGSVWIGALIGFLLLMTMRGDDRPAPLVLHRAFAGFSSAGMVLVGTLIATGAINSWFLVGAANVPDLWSSPYGRLLTLKLAAFGAMLAFAAANRFRLTPRLAAEIATGEGARAITALRRSVALEAALGIGILVLVGWFGTLEPPAAF